MSMNIKTEGAYFNFHPTCGNSDQYTGSGKIWEIAHRFNEASKKLNGHVTVTVRRQVKSIEPVGVL